MISVCDWYVIGKLHTNDRGPKSALSVSSSRISTTPLHLTLSVSLSLCFNHDTS